MCVPARTTNNPNHLFFHLLQEKWWYFIWFIFVVNVISWLAQNNPFFSQIGRHYVVIDETIPDYGTQRRRTEREKKIAEIFFSPFLNRFIIPIHLENSLQFP